MQLTNAANIKVYINQAASAQASSVMMNALPQMGNGLSQGMSKQMQSVLDKNDVSLTSKQWQSISNPIKVSTKIKNKTPKNSISGMAPMMMLMMTWLGTMMGSMLLWREHKKHADNGRFDLKLVNSQILSGIILAALVSCTLFFFAHILFDVPIYNTGSFMGLTFLLSFIFYLMLTCILDWLGMGGWPIVIVVQLLSISVLSYPQEMLSSFFRNGVYSWTPLRYGMELFTNNMYISGTPASTQTNLIVLISVGLVALVLMYVSTMRKGKAKKQLNN